MLKGQDILILLALVDAPAGWTMRELGLPLGLGSGPVHRSLQRLDEAGLYRAARRRPSPSAAEEFLVHGLRYVFPGRFAGEARGIPTAWAAAPLIDEISAEDPLPPVWPHPRGEVRGLALEPLHPNAPDAARSDSRLAARLVVVDAARIGDARVRGVAAEHIRSWFDAPREPR